MKQTVKSFDKVKSNFTSLLLNKTVRYFLLIIVLCSTMPSFAEINLRDSVQKIIENKQLSPKQAFVQINALVDQTINENSSVAENYRDMYLKQALPFLEKNLSDKKELAAYKALIYCNISHAYREKNNREQEIEWMEKALETAELANDKAKAGIYKDYAVYHLNNGDIGICHEYYYKAIDLYRKQNNYTGIISCLYHLAITYLDIRDNVGLLQIIHDMEKAVSAEPTPKLKYKLYAVKSAYFSTLALESDYKNKAYNDSSINYSYKTLALIDCCKDSLDAELSLAWEYYNMATLYFNNFTDRNDSIVYYLNKALAEKEIKTGDAQLNREIDISVYKLFGEMHLREKKYPQAEKELLYVLGLLDGMENRNTVQVDFAETYMDLVSLYESTGHPEKALKYQKLLQESEQRRYDSEKLAVINEMAARYEHEKKEAEIQTLQKQRQTGRTVIILTSALILLLLIILIFVLRFFKLKKERLEQEIYEKALLAEMKHNELKSFKEELRSSPTEQNIRKLAIRINESVIDKDNKKRYNEALSKIDIEVLDKALVLEKEKLSNMDIVYIFCFLSEMDTNDIGIVFNIEPASVRTVRYRIKKKIDKKSIFASLI